MAQALVRACEGVAAAANFWDIYIQAATTMRDSRSPLGGWLSEEYKVSDTVSYSSDDDVLSQQRPVRMGGRS